MEKRSKGFFSLKGKELREIFTLYNDPKREANTPVEFELPVKSILENSETPISTANIGIDKQYKFDKVKELHSRGKTLRQISKITRLSRSTVRKYAFLEQLGKRQSRTSTNLEAFINFLLQEENRGKTYRELHKTIVQMGFNGKYTQFCCKMNEVYNTHPFTRTKPTAPIAVKTWSPSRLSLMLYLEPEQLQGNDDRDFLKFLFEKLPQIKQMEQLVKGFKQLFITKEDGLLKNWIEEVQKTDCGLKNFAKNLLKDYEAVNNAVITTISNGQVEGQVNRIKNIKRKMYGKAGFQLLKKMVLAKSV